MYTIASRATAYCHDDADMELQSPSPVADESALLCALMERVQAHDQAAFEELYRCTIDRLYGLARRILNSDADAEEIVCELFARVWESPDRYAGNRGSVIGWLVVQCRSRSLDLLRKRVRQRRLSERLSGEQDSELRYEFAADLWSTSLCDTSLLAEALQELSLEQRQILALAFYKGLSHSEVARHNNVPLGTVKSQIRRALRQLKAHFQG